jgi:hypothetical protein
MKADLVEQERKNHNLKHNNRIHQHWAKTYQNEANALKLQAFPDKVLNEVSEGGERWVADKYAQVPIMLYNLAKELRHADPDLVTSVLK